MSTYFAEQERDQVFGALYEPDRYAVQWVGACHVHCNPLDKDIHKDLRRAVASAAQRQCPTVITLVVPNRPDSGYKSLLAKAVLRATAEISRDRFAPVSMNAVPGTRPKEDMLLVVLANDAGWGAVKDRAMAMRELDVVLPDDHTAARAHRGLDRLSAHHKLHSRVPRRFQAADMPQHHCCR